jgi:protein TonB
MPFAKIRNSRAFSLAVLAAALSLRAAAGPGEARVVNRIDPEFPREALQAGADRGKVRARMTVDALGEVVRVEILEALPRRLFDRAVVRTLSQWRFNAGIEGRQVVIDVDFRR